MTALRLRSGRPPGNDQLELNTIKTLLNRPLVIGHCVIGHSMDICYIVEALSSPMKFYSSTFLTLILAFFIFITSHGQEPVFVTPTERPVFTNIVEPPRVMGPENQELKASQIVVEIFNGFDCPDCRDFSFDTLPFLKEKYGSSDAVKLVYYTVPEVDNDDQIRALIGLKCAEEKGKFWEMYSDLQLNPATGREADLTAQGLGLELMDYRNCVKSGKYDEEIQTMMDYVSERGIHRKPTVLIGDYILYGNQPMENIEKIINEVTQ